MNHCVGCLYEHTEDDLCNDCSALSEEGCSCHLNPPCTFCENLLYIDINEEEN